MSTVSNIRPDLRSLKCPALLRPLQAWVMWRFETNPDPKGKPLKVPYYAGGNKRVGRQGTAEDRIQLVTFDAAKAAAARRGMEGVGFCPLEGLGIVALDFDDCMAEDGQLMPEVEKIGIGTYAEFSPSGNGIRVFFKGDSTLGNRKSHARKGWPYGFETFSTKGFVTFTGNVTPTTELCETEDTVAELTPLVRDLYALRFAPRERELGPLNYDSPPIGLTPSQVRRAMAVLDPGMPYDEWIEVGMALHHETRGEGFDIWDEWSSAWGDYPGTEALRAHWDSMGHRTSGRVVTARTLVKKANDLGERILVSEASADDFDALVDYEEPAPAADTDSDFEVIEPVDAPEAKKVKFQLVSPVDFMNRPMPTWVVDELLPQAELAILFGEPGSGKSFIALDIVLAIAMGTPWRGLKVKRCRVVYVVAEGANFFGLRLKAYCKHHDIDPVELGKWFRLVDATPNMLEGTDALELTKRVVEWGKVGVVVMDTFSRVMPGGNENSSEDVGRALKHCNGIYRASKALVLLVHHSGKDASKGTRGWSGIKGAADTQLEVRSTPAGHILEVDKQKDGDDTLQWGFALDVVEVGVRDDMRPITSCVVRELDAQAVHQAAQQRRKFGPKEAQMVAAFDAEMEEHGGDSVALDRLVERVMEANPINDKAKARAARGNLKRAMEGLCSDPSTAYRLEDGRVYVD